MSSSIHCRFVVLCPRQNHHHVCLCSLYKCMCVHLVQFLSVLCAVCSPCVVNICPYLICVCVHVLLSYAKIVLIFFMNPETDNPVIKHCASAHLHGANMRGCKGEAFKISLPTSHFCRLQFKRWVINCERYI